MPILAVPVPASQLALDVHPATSPLPVQAQPPTLAAMRPDYIVDLPGGGVMDTRCVYARGDRVRISQGPHAGRTATVESRQARWVEHGVIH